jgi:transcriptional regulator with XRE-family HTH domain
MIKNNHQLLRTQNFLEDIEHQIEKYRSGLDPNLFDLIVLPLLQQKEKLESEIREYELLLSLDFEAAINGPLSDPIPLENISELLSKLRLTAKLTQSNLAKRLDWEQANVSRFESENYNSHTVSKLIEYSNALGVKFYIVPTLAEEIHNLAIYKADYYDKPKKIKPFRRVVAETTFASADIDPISKHSTDADVYRTMPWEKDISTEIKFAEVAAN